MQGKNKKMRDGHLKSGPPNPRGGIRMGGNAGNKNEGKCREQE